MRKFREILSMKKLKRDWSRRLENDHRNEEQREHWKCRDCGKDCFINPKDYYMILTSLWDVFGVGNGMLCMDCMEDRLGHKLREEDILLCPVTEWMNPYTKKILGIKK